MDSRVVKAGLEILLLYCTLKMRGQNVGDKQSRMNRLISGKGGFKVRFKALGTLLLSPSVTHVFRI